MLLVSAEGRGKSTFLACLAPAASVLATPTEVFIVAAAPFTDWLAGVAAAFDLTAADDGREALMDRLRLCLGERAAQQTQVVIAIDDADTLPRAALAEILTFAGGWPDGNAPASFLFTGTSDLAERVADVVPTRAALGFPRFSLLPWGMRDLTAFIRHRMARQGGGDERFSPEAIARVHELSAGEPVTVSRMVARTLVLAQQSGEASIARNTVDYAATSLSTGPGDAVSPPRPQLALPSRTYPEGVPGFAEGAAPQPLAGRLPPLPAGNAGSLATRDPAPQPPFVAPPPPPPPRRLLRLGLVAVALAIAGGALWSQWQSPDAGSEKVVLPPPNPPNQSVALEREAVRVEAPPVAQSPTPTTATPGDAGTEAAAKAATAQTRMPPSPAPMPMVPTPPPPTPGSGDEAASGFAAAELMGRGDALMLLSDVSAARQFYLLAARRGDPSALTAVAGTYDPLFLQASGVRGVRADARQAIEWYRDAIRRGDPLARSRLASLVAYLRTAETIDDAEARRLLDDRS